MQRYSIYVVGALAVWLGWQVVSGFLVQRAPPAIAIRVAPQSAAVLQRAAEAELAAGRRENATVLARESLAKAPFSAPALRTLGVASAEAEPARANDLVTLAANLSLRDTEAHAWLVEQRLRRGDYASSFAHAETLVRRRPALLSPQVFALFSAAGTSDPRALPPLTALLARRPPWRQSFFTYLHGATDRAPLLATLVLALEPTEGRLTDAELGEFYAIWRDQNRIPGLRAMRDRLNRPSTPPILQNGDFEAPEARQVLPFAWSFRSEAGITASISDSGEPNRSRVLWVDYDGYASGVFAEQLLTLSPGRVVLSGEWRADGDNPSGRASWRLVCAGSERTVASEAPGLTGEWTRFAVAMTVPEDCQVQALRLQGEPGDRRRPITLWVDNASITAVAPSN